MRLRLKIPRGCELGHAVRVVIHKATKTSEVVEFTFNDILVLVNPGDKYDDVIGRYYHCVYKRYRV